MTFRRKVTIMEKKFIDILCAKFPSLDRKEVEQGVLLAELRIGEEQPKLAFRMVVCACHNRIKRDARRAARFPSYDNHNFPETLLSKGLLVVTKEEWDEVIAHQSRNVRRLAQIASEEASYFTALNPTESVWSRETLSLLRSRIKQRYLDRSWTHSTRGYYKARAGLVTALRRNMRKKK